MADYREHYPEIRKCGAEVAAVSVDAVKNSQAVARDLHLPFPILCDIDRRAVRDWNVFNPEEKGGIAKPAVFLIDRDHTVRFATVDSVATRVPAEEVLRLLREASAAGPARRKLYIPRFGDWFRVIRNRIRP